MLRVCGACFWTGKGLNRHLLNPDRWVATSCILSLGLTFDRLTLLVLEHDRQAEARCKFEGDMRNILNEVIRYRCLPVDRVVGQLRVKCWEYNAHCVDGTTTSTYILRTLGSKCWNREE